jgi:HAD superfamily hydrolase (TIGR01490 family)
VARRLDGVETAPRLATVDIPRMVDEQTRPARRRAAFFDVDRTLLRGSSLLHVAWPMRRAGLLPTRAMLHSLLTQARFSLYGFDETQIREAVRGVGALVEGIEAGRLRSFGHRTIPLHVLPRVYAEASARIEWHRSRGDLVFLVSSSPREFISELGSLLGVDGVAATDAELRNGRYTGRIIRFCHGEAKAAAVRDLAEANDVDLMTSYAYGDSFVSDLAMLNEVGNPICVNPDRALAAAAAQRAWPIERFQHAGARPAVMALSRLPRRVANASRPAVRRANSSVRSKARSLRDL